jgi:pimeloyl-ACP methyl ester carboxylesterase
MAGILLVHGAWHGAWCWRHFAARLTERGHDVRAMQLRGHDQRSGRIWHRLIDYVEDVRIAAAGFPEPPVIIGHSLGGVLVQKYLETHRARAVVLLATIPAGGALAGMLRFVRRHPTVLLSSMFSLSMRSFIRSTALVREFFFSPGTPEPIVVDCMARLQDESFLALLDLLRLAWRPPLASLPVLVLAAEADGFLAAADAQRIARAYGTQAEYFQGMGHDLMLDVGWEEVADRIEGWISELTDDPLRSASRGAAPFRGRDELP